MLNFFESLFHKFVTFYKSEIKPWAYSITFFIITIIIAAICGFIIGSKLNFKFIFNDKTFILIASMILLILCVLHICYKTFCIKSVINPLNVDKQLIKYLYYSITFLLFSLYYYNRKDTFLNTYEQNVIGISQSQYIFFVNFIGYIIISTLLYTIIFNNFIIKKVTKTGIELDIDKNISEMQDNLIKQYVKIVDDFSSINCIIDETIFELNSQCTINADFIDQQFIYIVDGILCEYTNKNPDLGIKVNYFNDFDSFLKKEYSYPNTLISKIKTLCRQNKVYSYRNKIFVYYLASSIDVELFIVIDCNKPYPLELGFLFYNTLISIEMSCLRQINFSQ